MTDRDWIARLIAPEAFEALARRLPASRLWSLLLEVAARRAAARTPAALLQQWERDRFVCPSPVDLRALRRVEAALLGAAPAFEAVELSPLAPLGASSVLGGTSQHRLVSALRGTEVAGDPTNALALECARRLRVSPGAAVRLASCQRVVRAQPAPKGPGFAQHFALFALASAGRETAGQGFTAGEVAAQVRAHLSGLDALAAAGAPLPPRTVRLWSTPAAEALAERVAALLAPLTPGRGPLEQRYYGGGLRFLISFAGEEGEKFPIADGGVFDWVARLTGNRRHAFVASGAGSQLLAARYGAGVRSAE